MMSNTELKGVLETYYKEQGQDFGKLFATAKKQHKTPRAALNSMEYVAKEGKTVQGLLASTNIRTSRDDEKVITSISFSFITEDGGRVNVRTPGKKYGGQEIIKTVQNDWPDVKQRLTPVEISEIMTRYSIVTKYTTYILTEKSGLTVLEDLDIELPLSFSFQDAVNVTAEQMESGRTTFETSPHLLFAEVMSVYVHEDDDGEVDRVTATLQDLDGERMNCRLENNLENLFDEKTANALLNDPEELQLAMRRMPVIVSGRVFIGREGQVIPGSDETFSQDVTSFVVKGSGWILDAQELPDSVGKRLTEQIKGA